MAHWQTWSWGLVSKMLSPPTTPTTPLAFPEKKYHTDTHNDIMKLTEGRGSPDSTPGHRRTQTFSSPSTWFHGGLAGWTRCGGTGSLGRNIRRVMFTRVHAHTHTHSCVTHRASSSPVPFRVSPLLHTPSVKFFLTTFFTSSSAWGSSGVLKQVR